MSTSIEAMKQMVKAIDLALGNSLSLYNRPMMIEAKDAGLKAIAEAKKQEPYAWADAGSNRCSRSFRPDWIGPIPLYTSPQQRQPLEGVTDIKPIGHHSLQLIFESQDAIKKFRATHNIKEKTNEH